MYIIRQATVADMEGKLKRFPLRREMLTFCTDTVYGYLKLSLYYFKRSASFVHLLWLWLLTIGRIAPPPHPPSPPHHHHPVLTQHFSLLVLSADVSGIVMCTFVWSAKARRYTVCVTNENNVFSAFFSPSPPPLRLLVELWRTTCVLHVGEMQYWHIPQAFEFVVFLLFDFLCFRVCWWMVAELSAISHTLWC